MDLVTTSLKCSRQKAVYQMLTNVKSLDDLETGVKHLLLENRCSFSDEEIALLKSCIIVIQQAKDEQNLNLIVKILHILSKLFIASDEFSEFF
jgi:hypothetical protein